MKKLPPGLHYLLIVNIIFAQNQSTMTSLLGLFSQSKGASQLDVGILFLLGGIVSTILMIPSGILSQTIGKKKLIKISTIISAISLFSLTLAPDWRWLILGASGFNVGFALFIPSRMNLIADYSTGQNRATIYGIANMAWPIGTIYGPVAAGLLVDNLGWNSAFYFTAIMQIISFFFASRITEINNENETEEETSKRTISWAFIHKDTILLFASHFTTSLAITTVDPLLPLYLEGRFGISKTGIGLFYGATAGFSTLIGQIPAGILGDKYGSKKLILASMASIPIIYILCALAQNYLLLLLLYMTIQSLWSLTWPTTMALLIDLVPHSQRGLAIGVRQTAILIGNDFGPPLGGYLSPFPAPFYGSAIIFATSIPLIFLVKEKKNTTS